MPAACWIRGCRAKRRRMAEPSLEDSGFAACRSRVLRRWAKLPGGVSCLVTRARRNGRWHPIVKGSFAMTRILIADDHDVVRSGVRSILEGHEGWEVVAEARD